MVFQINYKEVPKNKQSDILAGFTISISRNICVWSCIACFNQNKSFIHRRFTVSKSSHFNHRFSRFTSPNQHPIYTPYASVKSKIWFFCKHVCCIFLFLVVYGIIDGKLGTCINCIYNTPHTIVYLIKHLIAILRQMDYIFFVLIILFSTKKFWFLPVFLVG